MKNYLILVLVLLGISHGAFSAEDEGLPVPIEQVLGASIVVDISAAGLLVGPTAIEDGTDVPAATAISWLEFIPFREKGTRGQGEWSSWGDILLARNGKLYGNQGDHKSVDGHTYLVEYDPAQKQLRTVVDIWKLLELAPGDMGEGKIHGRPEHGKDGWIYFATYQGGDPPAEKVEAGYPGGHLVRYNPGTDAVEDLGNPLVGGTWPMFDMDIERGTFFAVGHAGQVMVYNVYQRKLLFGGYLPHRWGWNPRSTLLDPRTGNWYGSNSGRDDAARAAAAKSVTDCAELEQISGGTQIGMLKYDLRLNRFSVMKCKLPVPVTKERHKCQLRAYVSRPAKDGGFYCQSANGIIFKFFPDQDRIEYIDLNWGAGYYCTAMALSPDERYLYYTIDAHMGAVGHGAPILQYDLKNHTKRVLAYLYPYLCDHYNYLAGGCFGTTLSADGATLYMCWNGRFWNKTGVHSMGDVSYVILHIPPALRPE